MPSSKDLFCAVQQPRMAEIAENKSVDDRFVVDLTSEEEEMAVELEKNKLETEESTEFPKFPDFPLFDRVKELKLDEYPEEETEFYKDLEGKPNDFYTKMKHMPDSFAKKYYPDMCRRYIACEKRIKHMEDILWQLPREDKSMEEDRFEILGELLDKVCQGLEIWDEHLMSKHIYGPKGLKKAAKIAKQEAKEAKALKRQNEKQVSFWQFIYAKFLLLLQLALGLMQLGNTEVCFLGLASMIAGASTDTTDVKEYEIKNKFLLLVILAASCTLSGGFCFMTLNFSFSLRRRPRQYTAREFEVLSGYMYRFALACFSTFILLCAKSDVFLKYKFAADTSIFISILIASTHKQIYELSQIHQQLAMRTVTCYVVLVTFYILCKILIIVADYKLPIEEMMYPICLVVLSFINVRFGQ